MRGIKSKIFKQMLVAAAAFLTISMFAGGALADTVSTGTVATGTVHVSSYLNIRQSNSTGAAVVGTLGNGAQITVLGSSAGWYRVTYNGVTGWVSGHYVALKGTAHVTESLNIRQAGNAGAAITGRLYNGALVTITDINADGWYQISYYGGTGWVNGQYMTLGTAFVAGNAKAQTVIDAAQSVIGVKYVFGGTTVSGMDCSGLTLYAYAKAGITLPHAAAQQATLGVAVSRSNLQPGDLVFFDTDGGHDNITHVGVYLGNDIFVNAQTGTTQRVNEASLSNSYWSSVYMTARRIIS